MRKDIIVGEVRLRAADQRRMTEYIENLMDRIHSHEMGARDAMIQLSGYAYSVGYVSAWEGADNGTIC